MRVARSLLSLLLLLCAISCALLSGGAQWLNAMARTPGPAAQLVGPLASDPRVLSAIADELEQSAIDRIPTVARAVPGLGTHIETVLTRAVDEALAGEGVEEAWLETINRTRAASVAELDAYRVDPSETPTMWLDLTPFVELGRARLISVADARVQPYLEQIAWGDDLVVALGRPDARTATVASELLGLVQHWQWGFAAAGVLAAVGLLAGSRRGRWLALTVAALLGTGAVLVGRTVLGRVELAGSGSTQAAVTAALVEATADSLLTTTATWAWLLLALAGVGVVGLVLAGRRRRR